MYSAITIGTMILGGWVLPSGETPAAPAVTPGGSAPPSAAAPGPETPLPQPGLQPSPPSARPGSPAAVPRLPAAPSAFVPPMPGSAAAPANTPSQLFVPLAPTDPTLSSPQSPWQAPTSASTTPVLGFGSAAAASGVTPYRLPPSSQSGQSSSNTRWPQRAPSAAAAASFFPQTRPPVSPGSAAKPFSNYSLPPALSPYIHLSRSQRSPDFDNFSLYVRPTLEQEAANQRLGGEIMGLQRSAQRQTQAIQRMGQQIGTGAPQYFMNHGVFFPGLR